MIRFDDRFPALLPETYALLSVSNLVIHPLVSRIVLHGSRGLAGGFRPESDLDLSLVIDPPQTPDNDAFEALLREITETTLAHWQSPVELDLAVIFDARGCGLKCFDQTAWDEQACTQGGIDCFGLYKLQKGFHGLVSHAGVQVRRMYPCLKIWQG